MSPSKVPYIVMMILVSLQLASASDPLFHFCSTPEEGNSSSSSTAYQSQLTKLLSRLTSKKGTLPSTGFATASIGSSAYGLALCRGDVSPSDCALCAANATKEIRQLCPYNDAAVVWYDDCLLRYSDSNFLGKVDEADRFYMWNVNSVTNPKAFNQKTKGFLSKLSGEAVEAGNYKLFATGELQIDAFTRLYGMVQCTRDLSRGDCRKCLEDAVAELPTCCDGKQGGRVVGATCNFRYEIYPFLNV